MIMANETLPVLCSAIPAYEKFMSRWERAAAKNPTLAPAINEGLKYAYKYYGRMDQTDAYVVAMCEYMSMTFYPFTSH